MFQIGHVPQLKDTQWKEFISRVGTLINSVSGVLKDTGVTTICGNKRSSNRTELTGSSSVM